MVDFYPFFEAAKKCQNPSERSRNQFPRGHFTAGFEEHWSKFIHPEILSKSSTTTYFPARHRRPFHEITHHPTHPPYSRPGTRPKPTRPAGRFCHPHKPQRERHSLLNGDHRRRFHPRGQPPHPARSTPIHPRRIRPKNRSRSRLTDHPRLHRPPKPSTRRRRSPQQLIMAQRCGPILEHRRRAFTRSPRAD